MLHLLHTCISVSKHVLTCFTSSSSGRSPLRLIFPNIVDHRQTKDSKLCGHWVKFVQGLVPDSSFSENPEFVSTERTETAELVSVSVINTLICLQLTLIPST